MAGMPESSPVGRWRKLQAIRIDFAKVELFMVFYLNANDILS